MNGLQVFEQALIEMEQGQRETSPGAALIETCHTLKDSLSTFKVIESLGWVVLVQAEPTWGDDPIFPVVIGSSGAMRAIVRQLANILANDGAKRNLYNDIMRLMQQHLEMATELLDSGELAYLRQQWELCAADPMRKVRV